MLSTLSRDQIALVKNILQEDEERFKHFVGLLEKWIDCHAFIPKNLDKQMLPIYLRNCKYNLDQTKQKLEYYFVYKKRYPEAFCFYEFSDEERRALDNCYFFQSSQLTPDGCQVTCIGFRSPNTTGCDMNVFNKLLAMFATYKANFDVINGGLIIVADYQHLSPSIVSGILNPFYKRMWDMIPKVYPFRIGGIYLTFVPKFAVPVANTVYMEAGNEQMKKDIPLYCLPKEFGGTDGTVNENSAKFIQDILRVKPWFLEQKNMQMVGDIPKDLYEASGIDENFGTQGSFRKLNID